jgi:hypothetical protein
VIALSISDERRRTRRSRPRQSPSPSRSDSTSLDSPPGPHKSVVFIPLSPQSSKTLARHHQQQEEHRADDTERDVSSTSESESATDERQVTQRPPTHRRHSSDPSSDRPALQRHRRARSWDSDSGSDDVEILPDRFDAQGRPVNERGRPVLRDQWTSRSGTFGFRPRGGPSRTGTGDWDVRGGWGVGGTDPEVVERIVTDVQGVLSGHGGWASLLRDVVGGLQGQIQASGSGQEQQRIEHGEEGGSRRRRRRRRHS